MEVKKTNLVGSSYRIFGLGPDSIWFYEFSWNLVGIWYRIFGLRPDCLSCINGAKYVIYRLKKTIFRLRKHWNSSQFVTFEWFWRQNRENHWFLAKDPIPREKVVFSWFSRNSSGGVRENRNPSGNSNTNFSWRAKNRGYPNLGGSKSGKNDFLRFFG